MKKEKIEAVEAIREYANTIINNTQLSSDEKYEAKQVMLYALQEVEEIIHPKVGYAIWEFNSGL